MTTAPALKALTAGRLAVMADAWWQAREERLAADKTAASLKAKESTLQADLIAQMSLQGLSAIGGKTVRVAIHTEYQPTIKDWNKFCAYVAKTNEFELLERRPGRVACRERWEAGVEIPGIDRFPIYKLTRSLV